MKNTSREKPWHREHEDRNKLATLFNALTLAANITAWRKWTAADLAGNHVRRQRWRYEIMVSKTAGNRSEEKGPCQAQNMKSSRTESSTQTLISVKLGYVIAISDKQIKVRMKKKLWRK